DRGKTGDRGIQLTDAGVDAGEVELREQSGRERAYTRCADKRCTAPQIGCCQRRQRRQCWLAVGEACCTCRQRKRRWQIEGRGQRQSWRWGIEYWRGGAVVRY